MYIVGTHAPVAYPECHCQQNMYNRYTHFGCLSYASSFKLTLGGIVEVASCQIDQVCTKILLDVYMQPAAIALNYNIKKDMERRTIHIYIHIYRERNPLFNSLVWGSLTLAPIIQVPAVCIFMCIPIVIIRAAPIGVTCQYLATYAND